MLLSCFFTEISLKFYVLTLYIFFLNLILTLPYFLFKFNLQTVSSWTVCFSSSNKDSETWTPKNLRKLAFSMSLYFSLWFMFCFVYLDVIYSFYICIAMKTNVTFSHKSCIVFLNFLLSLNNTFVNIWYSSKPLYWHQIILFLMSDSIQSVTEELNCFLHQNFEKLYGTLEKNQYFYSKLKYWKSLNILNVLYVKQP